MGEQLSLKAAMPLAEILATCRKNVSNTGPGLLWEESTGLRWAPFAKDHYCGALMFSCDQAALWRVLSSCPSARPSVCLLHPFHNFWGIITLAKVMFMRKVKVRGQTYRSQRSKTILPQFWYYRTLNPDWIHRWLRNDTQSLKWHRRGALLLLEVKLQDNTGRKFRFERFRMITSMWIHGWL